MSIYILTTLNRVALVDSEESSLLFEDSWEPLDKFKKIAEKYKLKIEKLYVEIDNFDGIVCVIHNEVEKIEFAQCAYGGAMLVLKEVKSDETFFERTELFLKEVSLIEGKIRNLKFDEPQKRTFCFS